MPSCQLPIEAFLPWALLNDVELSRAAVQDVKGKGLGLVATGDSHHDDAASTAVYVRVPKDLILSRECVEDYAKVDQNFRQLLEVAGREVPLPSSPWISFNLC